jgi:hypothetical protein
MPQNKTLKTQPFVEQNPAPLRQKGNERRKLMKKILSCPSILKSLTAVSMGVVLASVFPAHAQSADSSEEYTSVVARTAAMTSNTNAQNLARTHGLNILNVTWEDTGRYKGSSVGPNISDMTIQVQMVNPRGGYNLTCMPVIRFPNFEDQSGDINPDKFFLLVGNQKGRALKRVTLTEYLRNFRSYLTKSDSWKGSAESLLAKRDTHVLVSAQACFLPIPKNQKAEFNPVLFNYQSYKGNPAVLAIIATREGTSATVIDNTRDRFEAGQTWGQRLFFNQKGERASLTGERASDFAANRNNQQRRRNSTSIEAVNQSGLNMVLLIQVPLKHKEMRRKEMAYSVPSMALNEMKKSGDVENAVIGHGKVEGPFTEIDNLAIERDEKYPVRVTVQFYKATSNGEVSENDLKEISSQIHKVYTSSDYVGSLVTGGSTGRPTEYIGDKFMPPDWWSMFWNQYHSTTGLTPEEAVRIMRILHGPDWTPESSAQFGNQMKKLEERREKEK